MSRDVIRWGIVGPGRIAEKVAADFTLLPSAKLAAVASRSVERARAFALRHGIETSRAYGSYAELFADDTVDVVYLATPNPHHHRLALEALEAGKHLVVEKPFTVTYEGAHEVVARAKSSGRFVMEGMWTRFQPAVQRVRELVREGAIGELRGLQVDLGIQAPSDAHDRFFSKELGGGALFDLGVYAVSFAQMLFGDESELSVQGSVAPTGVEAEAALLLGYPGGRRAQIMVSLVTATPGAARIFGSEGHLDVLPRFHHPNDLVLHRNGRSPEALAVPARGRGYVHELEHVTEAVREGRHESDVMPLSDTLAVMRVLGRACNELGIRHDEA